MKSEKMYIAFFIFYTTVFIILLLYVDKTYLPTAAAVATILSLTFVPSFYFLDIYRTKRDERTRISRNLYGEFTDTLDTLKWRTGDGKTSSDTLGAKKMKHVVTNKFLNHDVYDSLINSGKINFLQYELQQQVQNIFRMIKRHNQYLQITGDTLNRGENKSANLRPYYEMMETYEQDLLQQIPDILQKLKGEFPHITQSEYGGHR